MQAAEEEFLGYLVDAYAFGPTPADEVISYCDRLLRDNPTWRRLEGHVLATIARMKAMQGEFEVARELYVRGRTICEELGLEVTAAAQTQAGGFVEMLAGRPRAAEQEWRRGYDALEKLGERAFLSTNAAYLASALLDQGRDAEAERFLDIARSVGAPDDVATRGTALVTQARLLSHRREHTAAEKIGREALELATATDFHDHHTDARLALSEVLLAAGPPRGGAGPAGRARNSRSPRAT